MELLKKGCIVLFVILLVCDCTHACSMFKITEHGKTIVGNNEDWISANSEIWFEPAKDCKFGVAYLGFINHFPQGAINEAGLVFDVFVTDYLPVKNTQGKRKVSALEVTHQIMRNLETVHEVKAYFEKIDLSYMAGGVYMFVDKSGQYLLVEGDLLTIGNEAHYLQSNFIPSQSSSPQDVKNVDHYHRGIEYVRKSTPKRTMAYCASVMQSMQQESTQYTSIYDLDKGTINLYHYHNYENVIELDIKEELSKGAHTLKIPELFPQKTEGVKYYQKFNDDSNPSQFMRDLWKKDSKGKNGKDLEEFKKGFSWVLINIVNEWLYDKKSKEGAIAILKFGIELFPDNSKVFEKLGEVYLADKNYNLAISNYALALSLNPKSYDTIQKLQDIKELTQE